MRVALGLLFTCLVLMMGACSGDTEDSEAASSTTTDAGSPSSTGPVSSGTESTTTTEAPPVDVEALELTDEERACVEEQLPEGTDLAAVDGEVATEALAVCARGAVFGELFAANLEQQGYSAEEAACVAQGWSELSAEDSETLMAAGLDPSAPESEEARGIMEGVFEACGLDLPAS